MSREIVDRLHDLLLYGITTPSRLQKTEWYASKLRYKIEENKVVAGVPRPGQKSRWSKLIGNTASSYQVMIDLRDGRYSCTCEDFIFRGAFCKHLSALMLRLLVDGQTEIYNKIIKVLLERDKAFIGRKGTLSFGDEGLDVLFNGGIPKGDVTGIYGEPKTGKTWLCLQIAACSKRALYVDTEGMLARQLPFEKFKTVFERRFKKEPQIDVVRIPNLEELMAFVGLSLEKFSSGKKLEVRIGEEQPIMQSSASLLLSRNKYDVLIIDSISKPLKEIFGAEQQNLTARAAVMNAFMGKIIDLSFMYNIAVVIVIHGSRFRDGDERLYGGHTLKFLLKYLLRIEKIGARKRIIYRELYPGFLPDSVEAILKEDYGFVTVQNR